MPKCQFTTKYFVYNYETEFRSRSQTDFYCDDEEPLASGFCIFHDKDYLQDKTSSEEHKRKVLDRLKHKVSDAVSNNEPLLCLAFQLPTFRLSDLIYNWEFTKPVYFSGSQFLGKTDFSGSKFKEANFYQAKFQEVDFSGSKFKEANFIEANFEGDAYFFETNFKEYVGFAEANFEGDAAFHKAIFQKNAAFHKAIFQKNADFSTANFKEETYFNHSEFYGKTYFSGWFNGKTEFHYVLFQGKEKVIFDIENLSNVSFMNTDLTGVRFSDKARWGIGREKAKEEKAKEDRFKIVDERLLEKEINKEKDVHAKDFNLGSIKAVYRSLRENYEYRMRYDEAGQFFIREMELKRKYREVPSKEDTEEEKDNNVEGTEPQPEPEQEEADSLEIKQNNWFRRNLFSLTGWYYHLSRYGESIWRPTLAGLVIVFLSTLFWSMQENPQLQPSLPIFQFDDATNNVTSKFVGLDKFGEGAHWLKASERSIADFIPLLPLGSGIQIGIIDFVIKIVGGAVTFGRILIALRRRFERRYRH